MSILRTRRTKLLLYTRIFPKQFLFISSSITEEQVCEHETAQNTGSKLIFVSQTAIKHERLYNVKNFKTAQKV